MLISNSNFNYYLFIIFYFSLIASFKLNTFLVYFCISLICVFHFICVFINILVGLRVHAYKKTSTQTICNWDCYSAAVTVCRK